MFALIKITCFIVIFWAAFDITVRIKNAVSAATGRGLDKIRLAATKGIK
jgi:hypothetical protein